MTTRKLIGGSFAPPLDESKLAAYEALAATADRRVKEQMSQLIAMLRVFWETGESKAEPQRSPIGVLVTPLEDDEIDRIWDHVPYPDECDGIGRVFDTLPDGAIRNAAFHLLWYARELAADREPVTNDKLTFA